MKIQMKLLKTLGLAALVTILADGCVKRTQQEIELDQQEIAFKQYKTEFEHSMQEILPKIMQELEFKWHIRFEEIPKIEVTSDENECGKSSYVPNAGCYDFTTNTIILFMDHIDSVHFLGDERTYPEIISYLKHELGHAYKDQREDATNSSLYNLLHGLVVFFDYRTYMINKVLNEGIAEYVRFGDVSIFSEPDLTYCFQEPIEVIEEDVEKIYDTFYRCGRKLLTPLFYQFGVQPVVDYIVQHPPEVTGKLREDIFNYQKQIGEELGKGKANEVKKALEDSMRETP